jgi:hypothetical protein
MLLGDETCTNALAETAIGLFKTAVARKHGPSCNGSSGPIFDDSLDCSATDHQLRKNKRTMHKDRGGGCGLTQTNEAPERPVRFTFEEELCRVRV